MDEELNKIIDSVSVNVDDYSTAIIMIFNKKHMATYKCEYKEKSSDVSPIIVIDIDPFGNDGPFITEAKMNNVGKNKRDNLITIYNVNLNYLRKMDYKDICKLPLHSLERLLYLFVCDNKEMLINLYKDDEHMLNLVENLDL